MKFKSILSNVTADSFRCLELLTSGTLGIGGQMVDTSVWTVILCAQPHRNTVPTWINYSNAKTPTYQCCCSVFMLVDIFPSYVCEWSSLLMFAPVGMWKKTQWVTYFLSTAKHRSGFGCGSGLSASCLFIAALPSAPSSSLRGWQL